MKRSRSDQGPIPIPLAALQEDAASDGSMVSAPERIEGNVSGETSEDASVTSSTFEDALDEAEDRPYRPFDDAETGFDAEQANAVKARLRKIGAEKFFEEYLASGLYTLRYLATAFGVRPDLPYDDTWYIRVLGLCIQRELRRRQKLPQYNTIDDAVQLLRNSSNIIVITGAGISTSLGIPDFRSKNTGFYSKLIERGFAEPEDVFDIRLFDEDPTVFYALAKEILPVTDRCSTTHAFIKLLQDQGKLLTNYTQNIDNIEQFAGISQEKLIQCHGSWATASCRKCKHTVDGLAIFEDVKAQRVSRCKVCEKLLQVQQPKKRKRGSAHSSRTRSGLSDDDSDGEYDIPEAGVMKVRLPASPPPLLCWSSMLTFLKPGITFFHEQLPNTFFDRLTEHDRDKVDLVVVIGTSMKVSPVNEVPNFMPAHVPHIYISRDPIRHINFDIQLLGYCDDIVSELSRRAGWNIDHNKFEGSVKADVRKYDDEIADHWVVAIPGAEHTAEEQNDAEA